MSSPGSNPVWPRALTRFLWRKSHRPTGASDQPTLFPRVHRRTAFVRGVTVGDIDSPSAARRAPRRRGAQPATHHRLRRITSSRMRTMRHPPCAGTQLATPAPLSLGRSAAPCLRDRRPGVSRLRRPDANPRRDPSARGHPRHPGVSRPAVARTSRCARASRARAPGVVSSYPLDCRSSPGAGSPPPRRRARDWRRHTCVHRTTCDRAPPPPDARIA